MATNKNELNKTLAGIAKDVKDASVKLLSEAADAVKTVAPALWNMVRLKVIGDAAALIIVAGVAVGVVWRFWGGNRYVIPIVFLIVAFPIAGAVKRIIASDFFTLLEVLGLAGRRGGNGNG